MTRLEFQQLADLRARDAETLLAAQRFDGAYYLAGYAVECGIEACIAKTFKQDDIPEPRFVQQTYTHDLAKLEQASISHHIPFNSPLANNWRIVTRWTEKSRYENNKTANAANEMVNAVTNAAEGVLPWLKKYW